MKKWIKILFVACLTLSLVAGCSKSYPDGKKLLQQAQKKMEKIDSTSFSMVMDFNVVLKDKESKSTATTSQNSIKMKMEANGAVLNTGEARADLTVNSTIMGEVQNEKAEVYNVLEEGQLISYTNESGEWVKSVSVPSNQMTMFTELSKTQNLDILKKLQSKVIGTKVINKKDTYDLQVTIDAKMFEELLGDMMDSDETLSQTPIDFSQIKEALGDDFEMKYHLFVDQDTKEIVRMSMDLQPILEKAFDGLSELLGDSASISVDKADMYMDYIDFNKEKEIKLPEEALSAKEKLEDSSEESLDDSMSDFNTEDGDVSTQTHIWETMDLTYDSKVINVGEAKVQSFIDLGFKAEDKLTSKVKKDKESYVSLSKGEENLFLVSNNRSKKKVQLKDCVVEGVTADNGSIKLAGNIGVGNTLEEAMQVFGQFTNKTTSGDIVTLSYQSQDFTKSLTLTSFDGVTINSFSINDFTKLYESY